METSGQGHRWRQGDERLPLLALVLGPSGVATVLCTAGYCSACDHPLGDSPSWVLISVEQAYWESWTQGQQLLGEGAVEEGGLYLPQLAFGYFRHFSLT